MCVFIVCVVRIQILPVLRQTSLKQTPSLSISAYQVNGNVRLICSLPLSVSPLFCFLFQTY